LKSKHRSRAEARRRSWGAVGQSAGEALARHVRNARRVPPQADAPLALDQPAKAVCAALLLADGFDWWHAPLLQAMV